MPATRSSGPPTAASLQPILMEALENFKQKHSKQNQDLIHKNRFLLKSTAELERVVKELKNENLELRIQVQKANSQAHYWRQRAESSSSSSAYPPNPEQTNQIRMALTEIANRCKTLESSLAHPQPSVSNSSSSTYPDQAPVFNPTIVASTSDSFPPLLPGRSRAELIALRERRRSQFSTEQEESRLSFINECSGTEDRSETTLPLEAWQSGSTDSLLQNSSSTDPPSQVSAGPSNHIPKSLQHQFVVSRPNRRQELMAPVPKSSSSRLGSTDGSHDPPPNGLKTSTEHPELEIKEERSDEGSENQDSSEAENESLPEDQTSASFSLHNRAMSQLNDSSSSGSSSDSDQDDPPEDAPDVAEPGESKQKNARPKEQEALIDTQRRSRQSQRRSRKQRRTSLTPLHILENVSPADFSLPPLTLGSPESAANTSESNRSRRTDESDKTKVSGIEISNLATQSASAKRRDSGLTKEETEETADDAQLGLDEGWEKRPLAKKKRVRAELDAVSEEHPAPAAHNGTGFTVQESAINNLSGAGSREARRARKEVNYALPSLNKKMRRPDSDGSSTVKRKSSIKHPTHHNNLQTNMTNKPKSTSSNKSSGATPSTVPSNTSCSTSTTLTHHSSPLSSPPPSSFSSNSFSNHLLAKPHSAEHPPPKPSAVNRLNKNPTPVLLNNRVTHSSDHNKDILLNRGRRRTNNL